MMKTAWLMSAALMISVAPTMAGSGAEIYATKCAKCHGDDGKGDTKMGKKLKIEDLTAKAGKLGEAKIIDAILKGVEVDGKMKMKPVKDLCEADAKAVAEYVKSL